MIKKYKIKECPNSIQQTISIESLQENNPGGFYIFQIDTLNPDEVADIQEKLEILLEDVGCTKYLITTCDINVYEVLEELEKEEEND